MLIFQTSGVITRLRISILFIEVLIALIFISCKKEKGLEIESLKKVILTVTIGQGIEGNPKSGVFQFDTGMVVNYGYRALEGYINLLITLDGKEIPDNSSFIIRKDNTLKAEAEKKILWKFVTNLPPYFSAPVVGDDRTIYFTTGVYSTHQGRLYALNPDGSMKWSYAHTTALFSPVIGNDGSILVQDFYNKLLSFNSTGSLKWSYDQFLYIQFENVGQRCPAIGLDGTIYIGGSGLHAIDPANGSRKWIFSDGARVKSSPSIGADGTIYVLLRGSDLLAVNPDGTEKWRNKFLDVWEMSFSSPTIDQKGVIYLSAEGKDQGTDYSKIYAFNSDGTLKWRYTVEGGLFVRSSPIIDLNSNILITTKANESGSPAKIFALSTTGQKIWEYTIENVHVTGDDIYCTPSIDNNGLIYFGSETGYLYVMNQNGTLNNKYQLPCSVNWSCPAITSEGILYIGGIATNINDPGYITAVKVTGTGYASTPWPRFRHDGRNTGRYSVPSPSKNGVD